MNKDTVAGAVKETGGQARKAFGSAVGDSRIEAEGAVDQVAGNAQKNLGKLKDAVKK